MMEWTVQQLADRAGISGRTLRHYHRIGLLLPDRIGINGYRYYGPRAIARLQEILLLRDAGLPLSTIADVLEPSHNTAASIEVLEEHLNGMESEKAALEQRIRSARCTAKLWRQGLRATPINMTLEGFNDRYETEVTQRWGREVFEVASQWWHSMTLTQQRQWQTEAENLLAVWGQIHRAGHSPDDERAQAHATLHCEWFTRIPGTPSREQEAGRFSDMIRGMANRYETDPAFHSGFGGARAAGFAARALRLQVRAP